ncbi:MAG: hypothetical protein LBC38_05565 [Oscillospiraceae bacterium]|jgi:diaminopimelate epimerase|nr:hypothetical protein [Oscillospiraceae bacterium]
MEYRIYSPGGNDTALVLGDDFTDYKAINDAIMAAHPNVEQVGFLSADSYTLTMAGGEFCGNASRAACFHYLDGKPGELTLNTAGQLIKCGIDAAGEVWLELPAPAVTRIDEGLYAVKLDGITHIVVTEDSPPAVGMIISKTSVSSNTISPFVYVKSVETFVSETACLSGTIAAAAVLGGDCAIAQPSGNVVDVKLDSEKVRVSGSVRKLG